MEETATQIPPEEPIEQPAQYEQPDDSPRSFFTPNKFIIGGIAFFIFLGGGITLFMFTSKKGTTKNSSITPTPSPIVTLAPTKKPTVYPTSYPPITTVPRGVTPIVTVKVTQTPGNQTSSSSSPTATPSPTPTPTRTTGSISGGFYDAATNAPLTDSRFAAAVVSSVSVGNSQSKPTWKIDNLKPGHYQVSVDVDTSKYNQHSVTCTNCTLSNIQFASAEVDLKAGEDIQTVWTFDPK